MVRQFRRTRFRENPQLLLDLNANNGIRITSQTAVPAWYGEKMDLSIVLEGLVRLE